MQAFAELTDLVRSDPYLRPHFRFYLREVRVVAYAQFLESYKSVTLASMAAAFGVSPEFMDNELADFIVAGRLAAKIDKVSGVVETNRCASGHGFFVFVEARFNETHLQNTKLCSVLVFCVHKG